MWLKIIFATAVLSFPFFAPLPDSLISAALSHELIVKPEKTDPAKGEQVKMQFQAAHVFMVSEEAEDPESVELFLIQNGNKTPILVQENPDTLSLEGVFTLPADGPAILTGHLKPEDVSQTTEGLLDGSRKELEAQGKTVLASYKYENFAKTLLNVKAAKTGGQEFKQPVGQPLEIIPLGNIADLKAGDEMQFDVLHNGKRVSVPLWATYDGFSKEMNTYAFYTDAPESGAPKVKFTEPGLWMVRTELQAKSQDKDVQGHVLKAVLVFEVN